MLFLLALACPRSIAPALEVEPTAVDAPAPEPVEAGAQLAWMIGRDPLARRLRVPAQPADPAVAAFLAAPAGTGWWSLEATHPGTLAVPLARGARLATLEGNLADAEAALDAVIPLPRPSVALPADARGPLDWMPGPSERLLVVAERSTLLGWLDAPSVDARAAGNQLGSPDWDRLSRTPAGALVLARAQSARDDAALAAGTADLQRATWFALAAAAADRDAEQATLAADRTALAAELGVTGDPLGALLGRARSALTRAAGDDAATGLALVALAAERWVGACPDAPCGGLDRGRQLESAARWPGTTQLVRAWRVVVLAGARDHLDAAWERASFPAAYAEVIEALLVTPFAPVDRGLLRRVRPDPGTNLALARLADGRESTDRATVFEALDAELVRRIDAALVDAPPDLTALLRRMRTRATGPR